MFLVVYEPCYIPPNKLGFYVQQPQALSPTTPTGTIKRRSPRPIEPIPTDVAGFTLMHSPDNAVDKVAGGNNNYSHRQETLDLFPMHPTGILQEAADSAGNSSCHASRACTSSLSGSAVDRVYFDFFC